MHRPVPCEAQGQSVREKVARRRRRRNGEGDRDLDRAMTTPVARFAPKTSRRASRARRVETCRSRASWYNRSVRLLQQKRRNVAVVSRDGRSNARSIHWYIVNCVFVLFRRRGVRV